MFNYFIHPSTMSKMDAVLRMRMQEGAAGYGVFMMLCELLRDSPNYSTSYDPTVLAWALHESDITRVQRVCQDYGLFSISDNQEICCPWLSNIMAQHEEKRAKLSAAGKRSAEARARKANQEQSLIEQLSNEVATMLEGGGEPPSSLPNQDTQQTKPNNPNQNKEKTPAIPLVEGIEGDIFSKELIKSVGHTSTPAFVPEQHGRELFKDKKHNPNPLIAAAATFQLSLPQVQVLHAATRMCEIGSAPFMAFMAACKHCQETQFRPKFAFEYFMARVKDAKDL